MISKYRQMKYGRKEQSKENEKGTDETKLKDVDEGSGSNREAMSRAARIMLWDRDNNSSNYSDNMTTKDSVVDTSFIEKHIGFDDDTENIDSFHSLKEIKSILGFMRLIAIEVKCEKILC
jgi:hypothetical protein